MLEAILFLVFVTLIYLLVQVVKRSSWAHPSRKEWLISEGKAYITRVGMKQEVTGEARYEPNIKVHYDVNGITYRKNVRTEDFLKCTQHEWENVARYYPRIFTIKVRYDPKNPQNAFVEWR
jgi:hypothetical protein